MHTFGCRVNQYETESMREKIEKMGYASTPNYADSDLCIVNSCSVTHEADRKCRQFVRKILRANLKARVIITGCYATRSPEEIRRISSRIEVFSNQEKKSLPESVTGCSLFIDDSSLLTSFHGHTRAWIKVQDGCDAACTYCIIPQLRPNMESRPVAEILAEVKQLLAQGYKEIVLAGIRLGSYGLSWSGGRVGKTHGNLVSLLTPMIDIPQPFRIRLSSLEITEVTTELLKLAASTSKICPHFHLPLQSGSDWVLKRMGRWYDTAAFQDKINAIRSHLPAVGLTTDVIVGFPGETEEHFAETYSFLEKNFNGLHVFPYSLRKGTAAEKLGGHLPRNLVNSRSQRLISLDKQLRRDFQARHALTRRTVLAEDNSGFTDNGIRLQGPIPLALGAMSEILIPQPA